MTQSFLRGCTRCGGGPPLVTPAKVKPIGDWEEIVERVVLCQNCRIKANKENQAAKLRSTGKDPTK